MTAENGTSVVGAESARDSPAPPDLPDHPGSSLRDALLTIGALMAVLVAVELAVPAAGVVSAASILDGVAVAAFTVTGLIAWHRRPHNRIGRLMVAAAAALWAAGMADDDVAGMQAVGVALESLPLAVLLHLLLAFPSGRVVGRAAKATLAAVYLIALVLQVPAYLGVTPEVQTAAWNAQAVLGLASMTVVFVLVSSRLATAPPVLRRQLGPFIGYGCVALVIIAVTIGVLHLSDDPDIAAPVTLVQVAAASAFPVAFVVGMLAGAFGRAGELEEVARGISEASADPALLDALIVRALGDPSARVYWPESGRFVDSAGNPAPGGLTAPRPDTARTGREPSRGWWPIGDARNPAGALGYDAMLIADVDLVATVSAPLALAIENRSLVVALRASVNELAIAAEQVRMSRRRIVVAADGERRRIARDLHDGAQQRIVLIGIEAQRIGRRAQDPDFVRSVADLVSEQLRLLLDDLRSLVHGIMPATLQERGLRAGIGALADQMPVPVRVEVIGELDRLAAEVESTGYFVVAEALANAVKHASAQHVRIGLAVRDGRLTVTVSDDGVGMRQAAAGFGLRSLQDRVAALDGTVSVQSRPAGGTTLRAEFACG